jgi:AraC family transcriptional activator of pobA
MNTATPVVQRVVDFIEANYADGISLSDVARALNYSPSHLTSLVRKCTGRPVTAWIIERRILAARERLLATNEPVAMVAEAVGFRDVGYFARRFTRANGATPSQWRTRNIPQREESPSPLTCPTCGTYRVFAAAG